MADSIVFILTTYNRADSFKALVSVLLRYGDIYALDDGSSDEYEIDGIIQGHEMFYYKKKHGGKKLYYDTVNTLFRLVPKKYDYYFMVPDDFLPVDNFVSQCIGVWNKIRDNKKICINPYVSEGRLNKTNWTNFKPVEYKSYRKTQWVDMCFMCTNDFFSVLGEIPRIKLDWNLRPELSSGVGSYISRTLNLKGYGMYQTKTSLFIPQLIESRMNPWRGIDDPLNKPVLCTLV